MMISGEYRSTAVCDLGAVQLRRWFRPAQRVSRSLRGSLRLIYLLISVDRFARTDAVAPAGSHLSQRKAASAGTMSIHSAIRLLVDRLHLGLGRRDVSVIVR
jgi:hypothetical protein